VVENLGRNLHRQLGEQVQIVSLAVSSQVGGFQEQEIQALSGQHFGMSVDVVHHLEYLQRVIERLGLSFGLILENGKLFIQESLHNCVDILRAHFIDELRLGSLPNLLVLLERVRSGRFLGNLVLDSKADRAVPRHKALRDAGHEVFDIFDRAFFERLLADFINACVEFKSFLAAEELNLNVLIVVEFQ
jgi:hypothetical protein